MKLNGVSVCTVEKGKERTMPICKTDTTDVDSFTVVRHEVEGGTRKFLGEGRLRHKVIIKTTGLPPKICPVADAVGYDLIGYGVYKFTEPTHIVGAFYRYEFTTGDYCD